MTWSEQTMQALSAWLGPDTWYKWHPFDDGRFYAFVARVWNDERGLWDETAVRERIRQEAVRLHPEADQLAAAVAAKRVREGTTILDFLSQIREREELGLLTAAPQASPPDGA